MRPPPLLVAVVAALNIYLCDLGVANPALVLLGGFCCDAWDVARCSVVPMKPIGEGCTCAEGRLDGPEGQPDTDIPFRWRCLVIPEKTSKITVLLDAEKFARFSVYCQARGFKKSTLIARLIRNHLDREGFDLEEPPASRRIHVGARQ